MNRVDMVGAIAKQTDYPKTEVNDIIGGFFEVVSDELAGGGEIHLHGIGKLSVKERAARNARNPRTGATVKVPARNVPKFTAAKQLKEAVAGLKVKAGKVKAAAKAAPKAAAAKGKAKPAAKAAPKADRSNVVNLASRRTREAARPAAKPAPKAAPARAARRVVR